jgi:KUP system potassium uptake protein
MPVDALFLAAMVSKLKASHYLTLLVALGVGMLLVIWRIGNRRLMDRAERLDMPLPLFADMVAERDDLHRQARPAVFFQHLPFPPDRQITPNVLLRQLQLTSMLYQPTVIVEFITQNRPRVRDDERIKLHSYGHGIHLVHVSYGFAETIAIEPVVEFGCRQGWWRDATEIVYYLGREDLRSGGAGGFWWIIRWPFQWLLRQDQSLGRTLRLSSSQLAEVGMVIDFTGTSRH